MKKYFQLVLLSVLFSLPLIGKAADTAAVSCQVDKVAKPVYSGQLLSVIAPPVAEPGQLVGISVKIKNTGNATWFSGDAECPGQSATYLGTTRNQDRNSAFHAPLVFGETAWLTGSRIKMKTARVNPGDTAEFIFNAHTPSEPGIYREYFAPVIEGKAWVKDAAEFKFDMKVGQPVEDEQVLKYTRDILMSINLTDPKFIGEKKIIVDLSTQRMTLKLGDIALKNFPVSTGTNSHPTPVGTTKIQFKQNVRVAGSRPHYIMPLFMQFRKGGYGIHALPSLANDRGVYWREALNHIGTRRSHGCIRLLPADAEFAYSFADVGTEVQVVW